jgi:hypothetical protein
MVFNENKPLTKETIMLTKIKHAAEYAVLAYTAVIATQGLVEFTADVIDYTQEKIRNRKK